MTHFQNQIIHIFRIRNLVRRIKSIFPESLSKHSNAVDFGKFRCDRHIRGSDIPHCDDGRLPLRHDVCLVNFRVDVRSRQMVSVDGISALAE